MSNIYINEPPTSGKVLLVTSLGDIDVELWAKETPKAARNFIQLCMEGYYDGTIFHRFVLCETESCDAKGIGFISGDYFCNPELKVGLHQSSLGVSTISVLRMPSSYLMEVAWHFHRVNSN